VTDPDECERFKHDPDSQREDRRSQPTAHTVPTGRLGYSTLPVLTHSSLLLPLLWWWFEIAESLLTTRTIPSPRLSYSLIMTVPDDLLLSFFREASKALLELDYQRELVEGQKYDIADCRRCLLDKQKSVLNRSVAEYEQYDATATTSMLLSVDHVQARLGTLKHELSTLSPSLIEAMRNMDESARLALCKLVLYSECRPTRNNNNNSNDRSLQTTGTLDRSRLLEFIALCQTAVKLECVKTHLVDGTPLFEDLVGASSSSQTNGDEEPTAMKFPQARMERIQQLFSKAVGWDPDLTTQELRRIFSKPETSEYSKDAEMLNLFQQLVTTMNAAVAQASSLQQKQLSDKHKGGVTRVVSVQYSEIDVNDQGKPLASGNSNKAPTKVYRELSEDEQKQQIRMASQATVLQQELLDEMLNLSEDQRNVRLEEAKRASDKFIQQVMTLPAGRERITFLQSVDSHTSRLLATHKLWTSMLATNGGKLPPNMVKKS
jgi:hypothetical protein